MKKTLITLTALSFALSSFAQKADSVTTPKIEFKSSAKVSGKEPLIVIDGNKQFIRGTAAIAGMDPNSIESISVYKDGSAIKMYGEEGIDGVIQVTTKKGAGANLGTKAIPKNLPDSLIKSKIVGISVRKSDAPSKKNPTNLWLKLNSQSNNSDIKPLYIVDGKEVTDIKSIRPETIESINILKAASATSLYKEKGINGVMIITTKKKP